MDLFGLALSDYFNGDRSFALIMHRDDGLRVELPVRLFFAEPSEFSTIEKRALELCFGKVLDIGAGTGRHAKELQKKGLDIQAIDVSPEAVEIMKKSGLNKVVCGDIFDYKEGKFDTLLLLGHGIGMVESIDGLRRFLEHAHSLINPGGLLLFDSLDVRCTDDPSNISYQKNNKEQNIYFGEIRLQFEYKGHKGKSWTWLHVDSETLLSEASNAGWVCEIVFREPWGDYLAKLTDQ
jgi:2-polyprenyl-3-methyl-5-hydroxy-6-metoxy-1,4-benzoquinol methylase